MMPTASSRYAGAAHLHRAASMPFAALALACALAGCHREATSGAEARRPAPDAALIARGAYLAKAGDCAACHNAADHTPFAGGMPLNSPFGSIYASNITPDPEHGIGRYMPAQFAAALQRGEAPNGRHLYPAMPYPSFARLQTADVAALYQYFMYGVAPSARTVPETRLPFPFNQRWAMVLWRLAFARGSTFVARPGQSAAWNRGAYLVQGLGHCGACHTPRGPAYNELGYDESSPRYLTGATNDHWFAPNLTGDAGSGLGRWSANDIAAFLRGRHDARAFAFGAMAPVVGESTRSLSDDDLQAIAVYLKSLPARETSGAFDATVTARATTARVLRTGVPEQPGAGVYLAFCAKCHGADGAGTPGKAPALAGSALALSRDATTALRVVIEGSASPPLDNGAPARSMPGFRNQLSDTEIAQVVSFVRGAWGNEAKPVDAPEVTRLRESIHR
nr:cytochrome c [Paraburkholderia acidipaludis]